MFLNPIFCHDAVITLHELCDRSPNILVADGTLAFDAKFAEAHLPLLHQCVDDLGNAGVPTVAGSTLNVVNAAFHRKLVSFDHHVQFVNFNNLMKYIILFQYQHKTYIFITLFIVGVQIRFFTLLETSLSLAFSSLPFFCWSSLASLWSTLVTLTTSSILRFSAFMVKFLSVLDSLSWSWNAIFQRDHIFKICFFFFYFYRICHNIFCRINYPL